MVRGFCQKILLRRTMIDEGEGAGAAIIGADATPAAIETIHDQNAPRPQTEFSEATGHD